MCHPSFLCIIILHYSKLLYLHRRTTLDINDILQSSFVSTVRFVGYHFHARFTLKHLGKDWKHWIQLEEEINWLGHLDAYFQVVKRTKGLQCLEGAVETRPRVVAIECWVFLIYADIASLFKQKKFQYLISERASNHLRDMSFVAERKERKLTQSKALRPAHLKKHINYPKTSTTPKSWSI